MDVKMVSIGSIKPYTKNAKKHPPEQVQQIANSLREFGWQQPLVIDKDGEIIVGHGRFFAAKLLGYKEVPCVTASDLTEEQIRAFRLIDNKTNESEWDQDLLAEELATIFDIDMGEFGFMVDEPQEELVGDVKEDDYDTTPPEEATAKPGQIFQLGRHRLICGDSTDPEVLEALMDGEVADLLLTDPPYNVDYTGKTKEALKIQHDSMQDGAFEAFLEKAFETASSHMRPGAAYYIWYASQTAMMFLKAIEKIDWKNRQQLIWVKSNMVLSRQDYQWMHEPCIYGWKNGAEHYFIDSRMETTVIEDKEVKLSTMKKQELIDLCEHLIGEKRSKTVIRAEKPSASTLHPTIKPQALLAPLILNSSKKGWNVLDIFGGSGSTLIACEQLGRRCFMVELDPHYVDVIIGRWETFTGEKAVLIDGTV